MCVVVVVSHCRTTDAILLTKCRAHDNLLWVHCWLVIWLKAAPPPAPAQLIKGRTKDLLEMMRHPINIILRNVLAFLSVGALRVAHCCPEAWQHPPQGVEHGVEGC